jgi:hypothetical protein
MAIISALLVGMAFRLAVAGAQPSESTRTLEYLCYTAMSGDLRYVEAAQCPNFYTLIDFSGEDEGTPDNGTPDFSLQEEGRQPIPVETGPADVCVNNITAIVSHPSQGDQCASNATRMTLGGEGDVFLCVNKYTRHLRLDESDHGGRVVIEVAVRGNTNPCRSYEFSVIAWAGEFCEQCGPAAFVIARPQA